MTNEVSFDILPEDVPAEQPMDEPVVESTPEEPVEEPLHVDSADDAAEPPETGPTEVDDVEEAPQQETRAQKRIRQEIDRRKTIEAQLAQSNQQIDQQRQQLQDLLERLTPEAPAPEVPDFEEDPAAHLLHNQQQLQQQMAQQQERDQQQMAQQQQLMQQAQMQQRYESMESQFAQQNPDYFQRIEGLKAQRTKMWQDLGATPEQAQQQVQQEAWSVVAQGLQAGRNPAEVFYNMASGVPTVAAVPQPPVTEQVAQAAERQQQAQSLGSRGTSRNQYTVADLSSMDSAEFDKVTAGDNWERLIKRLGG